MSDYTLYIDESETNNNTGCKFFVMSGVIIKTSEYNNIENALITVKKKVWNNATGCDQYILHEKDITSASKGQIANLPVCNHIFMKNKNVILLYNELSKLFNRSSLAVLGVCLDKNKLFSDFGESHMNHQLTIAIQLLIEHYCMFLIENNATGDICYEAMQPEQNKKIQQRIYELKALGTMYYSPYTIQEHVKEIIFIPKSKNYVGLQLADFVPNTLGRYAAGLKPKNADFAKNIRRKLYKAGNPDNQYKFGFKILS